MNQRIPPWCLHWGRDGELAQTDRLDVLRMLVSHDQQLTQLMLDQGPLLDDDQVDDDQATALVQSGNSKLHSLIHP
jgi:hypothetical protein